VVLAHRSILVVRARSIHLFPEPALRSFAMPPPNYQPIARHSWGWLDGVAVTTKKTLNKDNWPNETLHILIRAEVDDPWTTDNPTLDLYTLEANPEFSPGLARDDASPLTEPSLSSSLEYPALNDATKINPTIIPYIFPPVFCSQVQSVGGPLQCKDVILKPHGTAMWIHPRARSLAGLVGSPDALETLRVPESLMVAVFPGLLNAGPRQTDVRAKMLWQNHFNNWTSVDYDEERGKIALGSSYGKVTLLDL
jgi:hypothetical protein